VPTRLVPCRIRSPGEAEAPRPPQAERDAFDRVDRPLLRRVLDDEVSTSRSGSYRSETRFRISSSAYRRR